MKTIPIKKDNALNSINITVRCIVASTLLILCSCADNKIIVPSPHVVSHEREAEYESERNLRAAFLMANAANAAYLDEKEIVGKLKSMGIVNAKVFNHRDKKFNIDTQGFVASTAYGSVIVFKGTASLRDLVTDLSVWQTPYPGGSAHSGFITAWNDIKPDVIKYLKSMPSSFGNEKKVWIGGHSLGGSIALLCGLDLDTQGYDVKGIHTFGQPMVLNKNAVVTLNSTKPKLVSRIFRFIFSDDPVPSIPPTTLGYEHIGNPYLSTEIGKVLKQNRDSIYWPKTGDHSMTNYIKTLYVIMNSSKDVRTRFMAEWLTDQDFPIANVLGKDWQDEIRDFKGF